MSLQKHYTTSTLQTPPCADDSDLLMKPSSSSSSPKSAYSSSCSSPPGQETALNEASPPHLTDKVASLKSLVPSILEASSNQAHQTRTPTSLPAEIKTRLHLIFSQIEHEFDSLYAENVRLQQELYSSKQEVSLFRKINNCWHFVAI
jgi:hypothetical protein